MNWSYHNVLLLNICYGFRLKIINLLETYIKLIYNTLQSSLNRLSNISNFKVPDFSKDQLDHFQVK